MIGAGGGPRFPGATLLRRGGRVPGYAAWRNSRRAASNGPGRSQAMAWPASGTLTYRARGNRDAANSVNGAGTRRSAPPPATSAGTRRPAQVIGLTNGCRLRPAGCAESAIRHQVSTPSGSSAR